MILQAGRPAVLFRANSRRPRSLTCKTLETEYWQYGSLKRKRLAMASGLVTAAVTPQGVCWRWTMTATGWAWRAGHRLESWSQNSW